MKMAPMHSACDDFKCIFEGVLFINSIEISLKFVPDGPVEIKSALTNPPGQNGPHFADDIFINIFMNERYYILVKILFMFVPKGPVDNNPALV